MANSYLSTVRFFSEKLAQDLESGIPPAEAVQCVQSTLMKEKYLHRNNIAEVMNGVGWDLLRAKKMHDAAAVIEALEPEIWNDSTERLRIHLENMGVCVQAEKRKESDLMKAKRLIAEGSIQEGADLMKSITGCSRGHFVSVGYALLEAGHPVDAVSVIEPVLAAGFIVDPSGGIDMAAINLLARCARQDPKNLKGRFYKEINIIKTKKGLPSECITKVMHVFRTGNTKYRKMSSKQTQGHKANVSDWQNVIGKVPELDDTGEARKKFETYIKEGQIAQALSLILHYRDEVEGRIIRLYEQQIFNSIGREKYGTDTLDAMVKVDPKNEKLLMAGILNLLKFSSFEEAGIYYCRHGRDNIRISRAFGQMLLQAQGEDDAFVMQVAETLLKMNRPISTLEIIKPSLLECLRGNAYITRDILMIFAKCAAVDKEIRVEFLEQMYEYKRHNKVDQTYFAKIVDIAFSDDESAVLEAQKTVPSLEVLESEVIFYGRMSRSGFFQEPHAILRAKPINDTAARVMRKRRNGNNEK